MKKFISILAALLCCTFVGITAHAAIEQPVQYLQNDSRWGSKVYSSSKNKSQTMANSGCGPTALAMVLNYYEEEEITPDEVADYAMQYGYRTSTQGTSWGIFSTLANEHDLEFLQTDSKQEALDWMLEKNNPLMICSMKPGLWTKGGHYIMVWKIENNYAYINDPASTKENRTFNTYDYMAKQCKQFFCFNLPVIENDKKYDLEYFISFLLKEPLEGDPQQIIFNSRNGAPLRLG